MTKSGRRNNHVAVKYFRLASDHVSGVHAVCIIYVGYAVHGMFIYNPRGAYDEEHRNTLVPVWKNFNLDLIEIYSYFSKES